VKKPETQARFEELTTNVMRGKRALDQLCCFCIGIRAVHLGFFEDAAWDLYSSQCSGHEREPHT
jgi:hypothetical protein